MEMNLQKILLLSQQANTCFQSANIGVWKGYRVSGHSNRNISLFYWFGGESINFSTKQEFIAFATPLLHKVYFFFWGSMVIKIYFEPQSLF